jgi:L-alanine-DL-glutamate epimerase-like enolase superfamily enzyme
MDLAEKNPGNRGAPRDELWFNEPVVKNGHIQPNDAPGFGVTLNEAML